MSSSAELAGAILGTLFVTLGLATLSAASLRADRGDRGLIWFGVFTTLYGVRLAARSAAVQAMVDLPPSVWAWTSNAITYVILVPASLLAHAVLGAGWRGLLRHVWIVNLIGAAIALAVAVATGRPGAGMLLNPVLVVGNVGIGLASATAGSAWRTWGRDGWLVAAGATVFMIVAVHETLRGGLLGPADAEPLAMLLFMTAVGTVVVKHVFHNERRVAAVGRELDTARRIQQSILPRRPPAIDGIAVAAFYDPMTEVAGDFYDFVVTPTGRLGVLVADVSGHGVPAALVASMVKIALATQGEDVEDPGVVLTRMNRALSGRFELAYVTAVFALIDPRARTVSYAAAGHPPPWLLRADGRLAALDARGLVLGLVADTTYETATVAQLAPGDALVFYTDGLTEAGRPEGELFGDRAFHTTLAERRGQPADRITSDLAAAARRWVDADFADDVTIVVASLTDVAT